MNLKNLLALLIILPGIGCTVAFGEVIYVDKDAPGPTHNGSSWGAAFLFLQDALGAAHDGDDIWVAQGTYKPDRSSGNPTGTGNRGTAFELINGVAISGGYAGFGEPDPNARNITGYPTILSGDISTPNDINDNSYHVVFSFMNNATAVIDGFTITGGFANGSSGMYYNWGGGMFNYESDPMVTNCTFTGNSAEYGGGMFNRFSDPNVSNCIFSDNSAGDGGGMNNNHGTPAITNCRFSGNSAAANGGGMYNYSHPTVTNCIFSGNSADDGGGMYNSSYAAVTNCTFTGNSANGAGGGMFIQNTYESGAVELTNCIFWGNSAPTEPEIFVYFPPVVTYCDVQGGYTGTGNIDADPLFADSDGPDDDPNTWEDNDYHLRSISPCIEAGDPGGDYTGQTDTDGQERVMYSRVDMGADEVFPIAGDFEPDEDIDFVDFAYFTRHWLAGAE